MILTNGRKVHLLYGMSRDTVDCGMAGQARAAPVSRTVMTIIFILCMIPPIALYLRLLINVEDYAILISLPLSLSFGIMLRFTPAERNPKAMRTAVWLFTLFLFLLWAWGFTGLIHRTSRKAILIVPPL